MNKIPEMEPHHGEATVAVYLRLFFRFKWLILAVFTMVMILDAVYTQRAPRIYQATSRILIKDKNPEQQMFFLTSGNGPTTLNNTIEVLRSHPVMEQAYDLMLAREAELRKDNSLDFDQFTFLHSGEREEVVQAMMIMAKLETKPESDVLNMSLESQDPLEAATLLNCICLALQQRNMESSRSELTNTVRFLDEQLSSVSTRLNLSEEAVRNFKVENRIADISLETQQYLDQSSLLENQLMAAKVDHDIAVNRAKFVSEQMDSLQLHMDTDVILADPLITSLQEEIIKKEEMITGLLAKKDYSPDHPEIINMRKEMAYTKEKMGEALKLLVNRKVGQSAPLDYRNDLANQLVQARADSTVATAKIKGIDQLLVKYDLDKRTDLPNVELELARLMRDRDMYQKTYSQLVDKFEESKIAEQAKTGNIEIIDEATIPTNPIKPKKRLNMLIGIVLGLTLGLGSALILQTFDTKIRTMDDIERVVQLPVLGTIPHIRLVEAEIEDLEKKIATADDEQREDLKKLYSQISGRLVSLYSPKSPVAESYRTLRTNIIAARKNTGKCETILITSSGPKEGKSTTTANLAITLAQMNSRTILLDVDLRRPMIHNIFHLERDNGLSDYMLDEGNYDYTPLIKHTSIKNLDIITSGMVPPNPSELISSQRMSAFLDQLKQDYDYVIMDSPPIIAVTDPLILAAKCDQLLLVIRNRVTEEEAVRRTKAMVTNIGLGIQGVIVNGIKNQKFYRGGYSYYNYYYYYYQDGSVADGNKKKNLPKSLR